jgi:hypothetical protein
MCFFVWGQKLKRTSSDNKKFQKQKNGKVKNPWHYADVCIYVILAVIGFSYSI